jgi:hypothetical protein
MMRMKGLLRNSTRKTIPLASRPSLITKENTILTVKYSLLSAMMISGRL